MAMPLTGLIRLSDLKLEFGSPNSSPALRHFYKNVNYRIPTRFNVPNVNQPISFDNFRGVQAYSIALEDRITWSGGYSTDVASNLGGTVLYTVNYNRGIKRTIDVGATQNKKNRWIIVVATHFHWGEGIYAAGMFRNIKLLDGTEGILLKDRVDNYAGESHSVYIKVLPIPDAATTVDLVIEQLGYDGMVSEGDNTFYVPEWAGMWGEFQLSVIGVAGLGDVPTFRAFDVAGFDGPFNVTLSYSGSSGATVPRKSLAVIAACGRGGTAGVCSYTDLSYIYGGQGLYLDENLWNDTMTYGVQHSTVALVSGVVIDY